MATSVIHANNLRFLTLQEDWKKNMKNISFQNKNNRKGYCKVLADTDTKNAQARFI